VGSLLRTGKGRRDGKGEGMGEDGKGEGREWVHLTHFALNLGSSVAAKQAVINVRLYMGIVYK